MTTPDLIEPFIGWKGLLADTEGGLWSPSVLTLWPVGEPLIATCQTGGRHEPPISSCHCGIYAVKTYEDLKSHHYHWGGPLNINTIGNDEGKVWVLAEIALYGRVTKARIGYKAARAAPQTIYVSGMHLRLGRLIQERYGVDLGMIDRFSGKRKLLTRRK